MHRVLRLSARAHAVRSGRRAAEPTSRSGSRVQRQAAGAQRPEQTRGLALVEYRCGLCHRVRGTEAGAISAPDLTHLMSRRTLAAGTLLNNPGNLAGWIQNPQNIKPGSLMPDQFLSAQQLSDTLGLPGDAQMMQPELRTPAVGIDSVEHEARLLRLWETSPGLKGFFTTVDHKEIGIRYIVTAFVFLGARRHRGAGHAPAAGGPNLSLLTPDEYNQLFLDARHDDDFLYASPILSGFSNYLWPLLLGSRDMAFPRLNALSYWIYLASGLFLYAGFLTGNGPNDGWFNYVPYASRDFNPGLNEDFYALGMVFLGISTTVGAANFIVTAFRTRAPGMSINRVPIMVWGTLTASVANLIVVPAVSLAFFLLWMDRQFGHSFLRSAGGGQPCCGSTCSGSSAIPGCMPSCCRPWAWSRTDCRCFAAGPSSAIRWSRFRPSRP
jgi:hypothetical protein